MDGTEGPDMRNATLHAGTSLKQILTWFLNLLLMFAAIRERNIPNSK